jgi:hypothetical protein
MYENQMKNASAGWRPSEMMTSEITIKGAIENE